MKEKLMLNMLQLILLIIGFTAIIGCDSKVQKISSVNNNLFKLLSSCDSTWKLKKNRVVMIIPVDIVCEPCRNKCISFLKKGSLKHVQLLLTSANSKDMSIFLRKENIDKNTFENIIIDDKNLAFALDLAFISPMIYYINDDMNDLLSKVELTPINIDKELNSLVSTN